MASSMVGPGFFRALPVDECRYAYKYPWALSEETGEGALFSYERARRLAATVITSGTIVVSDKLHAGLLAFNLHHPHVVLDQIFGKVRRTRAVAFEAGGAPCRHPSVAAWKDEAHSVRDALKKAVAMLPEARRGTWRRANSGR